jgi:DNA (cytosine-5)-methyltransferase 1
VRELSLFSGAGGGVLGTKLLGWETLGYVEWNEHCQQVLRLRIDDGIFDPAPIFCDVRAFISEGYAAAYTGMVDVVSAGFPCQPFSVAGNQQGGDDPRDMWPATRECLRIIRPVYAFLENVPGILAHGYIRRIFGDLAEMGYDAKWGVLGAGHIGGWHLRERFWLVATDTRQDRVQGDREKAFQGKPRVPWEQDVRRLEDLCGRPGIPPPLIRGTRDGVANYLERISAIGNGQIPIVAATAWQILSEGG